jgi:hypothetical protein
MEYKLGRDRPEPGCLSDFQLDAWVAGDATPEQRLQIEPHLTACSHCQVRLAALEGNARIFAAEAPPLRLSERKLGRTRRSVAMGLATVLAAAAVVLIARPGRERDGVEVFGIRTKGKHGIGFFVKRGEAVRRGSPGQIVHPGDELLFTYSTLVPAHLAVLSRDEQGHVTVFYPVGERTGMVAPAVDEPVPLATRLDGVLGTEAIFGVFCGDQVATAALRAAVAETPERTQFPAGCSSVHFTLEKRPLP